MGQIEPLLSLLMVIESIRIVIPAGKADRFAEQPRVIGRLMRAMFCEGTDE